MKKIALIAMATVLFCLSGATTAHAKVKQANRILWNKSAKTYEQKINEGFVKVPKEPFNYSLLPVSQKQLNRHQLILYRLSAHKKYLVPVRRLTWAAAHQLTGKHTVTIKRIVKIKRPAIYFEISYKTKHGVKSYWVWHRYTGNPYVFDTVTKDDWQHVDYFINHPDPF